jgi:hypothetical protein
MSQGSQSPTSPRPEDGPISVARPHAYDEPRHAFRAALGRYKGTRLAAIRLAQGARPGGFRIRPSGNADEITEHLDEPAAVQALLARLDSGSYLALSLFGLTESPSLSQAGISHSLRILGAEPLPAILPLLELGLLAVVSEQDPGLVDEFAGILASGEPARVFLRVHPAVPKSVRTARPRDLLPRAVGPIGQVREPDGLEAILRLAALWQRVGAEPLRQTQQGVLYKRDRDRIDLDPVLAAPIADSFIPLPDSPSLWLALARRVGLIELEPGGERLLAAPQEFWTENEFHLPQMIATGWLSLPDWYELQPEARAANVSEPAAAYFRSALLLWLSTLADSEWVALEDLADHVAACWPASSQLSTIAEVQDDSPPRSRVPSRGRARTRDEAGARPRTSVLIEAILLGAAYPLGLVRTGLEGSDGRRVVQLSPLGRYVLAVGPTPPPRPAFEQFLFVQPNFEVIAYRQGLTPQLVGRLSRFAWWTQIGSALELKLSQESIVHGLDRGSKPAWMLETLTRHSQRPLSRGVIEAIKHWAERRERVVYYGATTLIEFGSQIERDQAVDLWPLDQEAPPIPVAERFLLVEDDRTVPYARLRLTSSRDYRRPPEICVTVEPDGVTLALDPARADLLVDAELAQFTEAVPLSERGSAQSGTSVPRRFVITGDSLQRGVSHGMAPPRLSEWFERRAGRPIPASVQLLLLARSSPPPRLEAVRLVVLTLPAPEVLEGLRQLPATRSFLGESLGPTSVAIAEDQVAPLQSVLKELGITLEFGPPA